MDAKKSMAVIQTLETGLDVTAMEEGKKLTARQALAWLRCKGLRQEMAGRRRLLELQCALMAEKHSVEAINQLAEGLKGTKAVRVKAALALISLAGLESGRNSKRVRELRTKGLGAGKQTQAERDARSAAAEVILKQRRKEAMGAPPGEEQKD